MPRTENHIYFRVDDVDENNYYQVSVGSGEYSNTTDSADRIGQFGLYDWGATNLSESTITVGQ